MSELKVSIDPVFTLTLNDAEVWAFRNLIGHTNPSIRKRYITEEEDDLLHRVYISINDQLVANNIKIGRRVV